MDNPEQMVTDRIEAIKNPELKAALQVIWTERTHGSNDRNSADWGIDGTDGITPDPEGGTIESGLTIGICQW